MKSKTSKITQKAKKIATKYCQKTIAFAKENGISFVIYAIACDLFDELILPGIMIYLGHPVLAGAIGLSDLDWATYPLCFVVKNKLNQFANIALKTISINN